MRRSAILGLLCLALPSRPAPATPPLAAPGPDPAVQRPRTEWPLPVAEPKKKKREEEITQVLELPKEPPPTVVADSRRLSFHVAPLTGQGLLSQQVREALRALLRQVRGASIVKLRAFVAGTGDLRRVQAVVSESFTERRQPLPVLSVVQVGALPLAGAQVALEAAAVERGTVNPHGLAFISGQAATAADPLAAVGPLLEQSLGGLRAAAQSAGAAQENVLRVTCFVSSLEEAPRLRERLARLLEVAAGGPFQACKTRGPIRLGDEAGDLSDRLDGLAADLLLALDGFIACEKSDPLGLAIQAPRGAEIALKPFQDLLAPVFLASRAKVRFGFAPAIRCPALGMSLLRLFKCVFRGETRQDRRIHEVRGPRVQQVERGRAAGEAEDQFERDPQSRTAARPTPRGNHQRMHGHASASFGDRNATLRHRAGAGGVAAPCLAAACASFAAWTAAFTASARSFAASAFVFASAYRAASKVFWTSASAVSTAARSCFMASMSASVPFPVGASASIAVASSKLLRASAMAAAVSWRTRSRSAAASFAALSAAFWTSAIIARAWSYDRNHANRPSCAFTSASSFASASSAPFSDSGAYSAAPDVRADSTAVFAAAISAAGGFAQATSTPSRIDPDT